MCSFMRLILHSSSFSAKPREFRTPGAHLVGQAAWSLLATLVQRFPDAPISPIRLRLAFFVCVHPLCFRHSEEHRESGSERQLAPLLEFCMQPGAGSLKLGRGHRPQNHYDFIKADAPNPAVTNLVYFGREWRGVAAAVRSATPFL